LEPKTFAELGLSPKVQAAIDAAGYTTPTPIQAAAIPIAISGRDVLGIAQTGTGKTASFVLPMITRLETGRARARMPRSLILAPTRELAAQVAQSFERYGKNHKLSLALLIGGVSMDDQVKKLDRGVDVLIATPGRLLDHFQRGRVMLMGVEILVIDEADRMLDMGFIPDIEKICKLLPGRRQTLFFSATMPPEITRLVSQFLKDPVRVEVAPPATTAKTIIQRFVFCRNGEDWAKREALRELIRNETVKNAIIFCNRKVEVAILHRSLVKHGFSAGALHGDMDQKSRMETLDKFRSGELMLLAASDVAARGLDIPDVSHIFNFDLPWQPDDYVHRIGRTGRAGKEGHSLSLVTVDELKSLKDIEKMLGEPVVWIGEGPSEADYAEAGKKRRRGRGGAQRGRGRGPAAGARAHKERHGERQPGQERREARSDHGGAPKHGRPAQEPRRHDQPRAEKQQPRRQGKTAGNGQAAPPQRRERQPQPQKTGFADNVPAFLRNPIKRPVKVAGE
jgi:superfamily II DNA/RNA helicase